MNQLQNPHISTSTGINGYLLTNEMSWANLTLSYLFSEYLMALFSIKLFFKEIGAETF